MLEFRRKMNFFRHKSFQVICALFALFVISGDLIADSIHDSTGACAAECADHDSCPACGCTIHNGSAIAASGVSVIAPAAFASADVRLIEEEPTIGAKPSIDHPPQLS